ncbi:MAG: hypothetical protein JWO67_5562 [Streptosporangiaceae bacterium]|nr:hypothetical protein [Streptosporangiaceae bacterium]
MTVMIIVACLAIAGSELYLARGARRVSDRLERLEAVTVVQDERIEALSARLDDTEPDPARRLSARQSDAGLTGAGVRLREVPGAPQDAGEGAGPLRTRPGRARRSLDCMAARLFPRPPGRSDRSLTQEPGGVPADSADPEPVPRERRRLRAAAGRTGVATALGVLLGAVAAGGVVVAELRRFLDYYGGVLALVALSLSVVAGLVATDRAILTVRHRILAQGLHRAVTLVGTMFLLVHVLIQILTHNADAIQVVLPLGRTASMSLGTVAAQLTAIVILTGLVRGRFAISRRPGLWRAAHSLAYLGWVCAMLHGLLAGRRPATWVTWSYAGCAAVVGVSLLARALVTLRPRTAQTQRPPPGPGAGPDTAGPVPDQQAKVPR